MGGMERGTGLDACQYACACHKSNCGPNDNFNRETANVMGNRNSHNRSDQGICHMSDMPFMDV